MLRGAVFSWTQCIYVVLCASDALLYVCFKLSFVSITARGALVFTAPRDFTQCINASILKVRWETFPIFTVVKSEINVAKNR